MLNLYRDQKVNHDFLLPAYSIPSCTSLSPLQSFTCRFLTIKLMLTDQKIISSVKKEEEEEEKKKKKKKKKSKKASPFFLCTSFNRRKP